MADAGDVRMKKSRFNSAILFPRFAAMPDAQDDQSAIAFADCVTRNVASFPELHQHLPNSGRSRPVSNPRHQFDQLKLAPDRCHGTRSGLWVLKSQKIVKP